MSPIARIMAAAAVLITAASSTAMAQDYNANPTYGTLNLNTGFQPDPTYVSVQSGGSINAQTLSSSCQGFIANAPDVRLNFHGGSLPLILSVNSAADTTLVVNAPDGSWYCDDDGGVNGLNPALRFDSPQTGQYDVWIGTYGNASLQDATLSVSELSSQ
jgi:hypothetical protein